MHFAFPIIVGLIGPPPVNDPGLSAVLPLSLLLLPLREELKTKPTTKTNESF